MLFLEKELNDQLCNAAKRLSVYNQFNCSKKYESILFCKECEYYYEDLFDVPQCLKEQIGRWAVYHIEQEVK